MFRRCAAILIGGAGLLSFAVLPFAHAAEPHTRDPFFGEALFHAHQGHYFEALERLDAELSQHYAVDEPKLDTLYRHLAEAEFSVGDFELHYRMHHRAGRAIRAVLEGNVDDRTRAHAAYRLARLHLQKNQPADALKVIDSVRRPFPDTVRDDLMYLEANVLSALGRADEAAVVLKSLQGSKSLHGFSAYNLGIALLESSDLPAAVNQLDRAGRIGAANRETQAIRDKSNLVLGTLLFEAGEFERAQDSLDRVRLEGPYSNQALLRAGWSAVSAERYDRAIVPWTLLAERDATDAAVQEAQLALPFAYSKLNVHSRAAVLYERAAGLFGSELQKLDASLASVEEGHFLEALRREEIRQNKDWGIRLRSLPGAPETYYLITLIASHDFQTALQNYLDLTDMRRKLLDWDRSLLAFADMATLRQKHFEPRLPEIDETFRRLDARMRVRLEQRAHLQERLTKLLVAPRPDLLATAEEHQLKLRLRALRRRLDGSGGSSQHAQSLRARIDRLEGQLEWKLQMEYHDRLTAAHTRLRSLNADVNVLQQQYDGFVRTRQAASHSYVGYRPRIESLRRSVSESIARIDALERRQGKMLEAVARQELLARRERLEGYQNKARFAFADSYDRASKRLGQDAP